MKSYMLKDLSPREIDLLVTRCSTDVSDIFPSVRTIVNEVCKNGDSALRKFSLAFDNVDVEQPRVTEQEFETAERAVGAEIKNAIRIAARNIESFHRLQIPTPSAVETEPGVRCQRQWRAIPRVGLYVPGGSASLVSTVLMLAIPARLAGCADIVLCTPPRRTGEVAPEILVAAQFVGVRFILKAGGAQAIAAMGCGTETIPKVHKIFGPGNRFVTAAKLVVSQPPFNVAIDMPAGPTELLIVADETSNPRWLAADLISQAEHGEDSQVVLVSTSTELVQEVESELAVQLNRLPRAGIAERALKQSFSLVVENLEQAIDFSNKYAPEHLILAVRNPSPLAGQIVNAGSVFLGALSSVVFGDYAAGTNHTLPTGGWARSVGGMTVESFMKPIFFQDLSPEGFRSLAPTVKSLARAEHLEGHALAIAVREELL